MFIKGSQILKTVTKTGEIWNVFLVQNVKNVLSPQGKTTWAGNVSDFLYRFKDYLLKSKKKNH